MRNLVRWRNFQRTGTFSGKPKPSSGFSLMLLRHNKTIAIDAVYQADSKQFADWVAHKYHIALDPEIDLAPKERLEFLQKRVDNSAS